MKKIILIFSFCVGLLPFSLFAATDLTMLVSPEIPAPHSQVTLTLQSYIIDVNTSSVVWTVNGKTVLSGEGEKSLKITTEAVGTLVSVKARVTTPSGDIFETSITLSPQSIDLLWEAVEGYTPPFYQGKALLAEGSSVRITALPNIHEGGRILSPESLSYAWYVNDQFVENASGMKKQSLTTPLDVLQENLRIKVRVTTKNGTLTEKQITIRPRTVLPVLYPHDPTLGTDLSHAFSGRIETVRDLVLSLEPFYLSRKNGLESSSEYSWLLNGLPVTPEEKTILALRPKENSYGVQKLFITMENTRRKLQKADISAEIIFDTRR